MLAVPSSQWIAISFFTPAVSNAGTATVVVSTINFYGTGNFTKFIQLELLGLSIDCSTCSRVSQFMLQELRHHETKHADSNPHQLMNVLVSDNLPYQQRIVLPGYVWKDGSKFNFLLTSRNKLI